MELLNTQSSPTAVFSPFGGLKKKRDYRPPHDLQVYSAFREKELREHIDNGLVSPDSRLSYEMNIDPHASSIFFKDGDMSCAVAVLPTNLRQEIETGGNDNDSVDLKSTPWVKTFDSYTQHGILDVLHPRPDISKVQNVFTGTKDSIYQKISQENTQHRSSKRGRRERAEMIKSKMEAWENAKDKKGRCESLGEDAHSEIEGVVLDQCRSETTSPESCMAKDFSMSPLVRSLSDTMQAPLSQRIALRVSTPEKKVSTVSHANGATRFTLFKTDQLDDLHLDVSPRDRRVDVDTATEGTHYPYAHYSYEDWSKSRRGTKREYGNLFKKGWRKKDNKNVQVVTFKQLREEDKRHLERLKSDHEWNKWASHFMR